MLLCVWVTSCGSRFNERLQRLQANWAHICRRAWMHCAVLLAQMCAEL